MTEAIRLAREAYLSGDYAIGAVVVRGEEIIARGTNRVKVDANPTHHAEIVAIREASKALESRHLENCVLYTTHEPCPMCAAAAIWARMDGIICGARMGDMIDYRSVNGNVNWSWRTIRISAQDVLARGEPKLFLIGDFMRQECIALFHSEKVAQQHRLHR